MTAFFDPSSISPFPEMQTRVVEETSRNVDYSGESFFIPNSEIGHIFDRRPQRRSKELLDQPAIRQTIEPACDTLNPESSHICSGAATRYAYLSECMMIMRPPVQAVAVPGALF